MGISGECETYDDVAKRIENALEGTGWSFRFERETDGTEASFLLETHSPAGEDLCIEAEVLAPCTSIAEIKDVLKQTVYDYDADEYAEFLISTRGKHGEPDSIRLLLDDAEAIGEQLKELYRLTKELS